jgi:Bacterial membrane protein YfhO
MLSLALSIATHSMQLRAVPLVPATATLSCSVTGATTADLPVVSSEQDDGLSRRHWSVFDALGLAGVVVAGVLVLVPALAHGTFLGPYDILQNSGLNKVPNVTVHNSTQFDQISLFIPLTNQVWTQVHQGHLPLWNPYSALGMPLAFNWESGPLSLPVLIGYLLPVRLAYTAQVVVTIVVAGTGVYVLGKVLRLGILGCMMAAIVFELSGYFIGNLGWPLASVWSWGGWLFAAVVLVLRGEKRSLAIVFLAVIVALAIYAGNPEDQLLLVLSAAIFALAMLVFRLPALGGSGPIRRPAIDLGLSAIAGAALAAPLILPGLQLARGSNRTTVGPDLFPKGLPPQELLHLIFQGFDGLPLSGSQWFGVSAYEVTCAYVGVTVLVLAATALVFRWRRPEVRSIALVAVAMGLLVFVPPLVSFLDSSGARIYWIFAIAPMVLAIAVLSGIGMDVLVKSQSERRVLRVLGIGFGAMTVLLGIVWLVGRRGLTPSQTNIRSHSFIWPTIEVIVGLGVVWALAKLATRTRTRSSAVSAESIAGSLFLVVVTCFLLASGAPLISSSSDYPTSTPAVASLQRAVGHSIVGIGGSPTFPQATGIMVNANVLYNVQEFAGYDPMTPRAYFSLYKTPVSELAEFGDIFSPAINSTQAARLYGISYLLEPPGVPGPRGSVFDRRVGNEGLYRVPGAAVATLVALRPSGSLPGIYAIGAPVAVAHPSPSSWRMVTDSPSPSVLRLRLTNVPGWRATIDGKPVDVSPFARTMQQVRVPPGRHVVELHYWPKAFSVGVILAFCAVLGLATLLILGRVRSRRQGRSVDVE